MKWSAQLIKCREGLASDLGRESLVWNQRVFCVWCDKSGGTRLSPCLGDSAGDKGRLKCIWEKIAQIWNQVHHSGNLGWPSDSRELLTSTCVCTYPWENSESSTSPKILPKNIFFKDTFPLFAVYIGFPVPALWLEDSNMLVNILCGSVPSSCSEEPWRSRLYPSLQCQVMWQSSHVALPSVPQLLSCPHLRNSSCSHSVHVQFWNCSSGSVSVSHRHSGSGF